MRPAWTPESRFVCGAERGIPQQTADESLSGSRREGDSGGGVAAVSVGVLVEVLLVVVLGVEVRRGVAVVDQLDLGGDRVEPAAGELLAVLLGQLPGGLLLLGGGGVDGRAVLGAHVV